MQLFFEAKYIAIKWFDKDNVSSIKESISTIPVEILNEDGFQIELQTYTRIENGLDAQVAFKIINENYKYINPYFINAENEKIPLIKIKYNDDEWWIENGTWVSYVDNDTDELIQYKSSPLWNHIGNAEIVFGGIICKINIRAITFTIDELDKYLKDFRNDFWYLILKQDSLTQGKAKNQNDGMKLLREEELKQILHFIKYAYKILENPKKELREIQSVKEIKKVKPVVKTFIEIASSGYKKQLTSRDTIEVFNIVENRFIHYAIQKVYDIVYQVKNISTTVFKDLFEDKIKEEQARINELKDYITINKVAYENDIKALENKLQKMKIDIKEVLSKQNKEITQFLDNNFETVTIQTKKMTIFKDNLQYKGTVLLNNGDWFQFVHKNDFYNLEFDKNLYENILEEYSEYKITAYIEKNQIAWESNGRTGTIYKRVFKYIESIEPLSLEKELVKYKQQKQILEQKNFKRDLTLQEKEEQEFEKKALYKSIKALKKQKANNEKLEKDLEPIVNRLYDLLQKCNKLNITQDSYFPNSMTFIQNTNYQGVYKYYQNIKSFLNIDDTLLSKLQATENIGLVDIPTLYERWCLLQIIKVLIDNFHFTPEKNWKMMMSNQILDNPNHIRNIKILFINQHIKRKIQLGVEYELTPNGKRPDFVLDIESTFGTNNKHRLVMDAKFHEEVDIKRQIEELYHFKNYSEDNNNTVFILHPDVKAVKTKRSPQKWGDEAYYGEVDMFLFDWDKDKFPNHKYGAILLSPIKRSSLFLDNLQRLIGMSMQYQLEDNTNLESENRIDSKPLETLFCIKCGSNDCNISEPIRASEYPNRWMYNVTCNEQDCGHFFAYNYCWKCKHRLIKNGNYWTYHSMQVLNPMDIKCPNCNRLLSELNRE